MEHWDQLWPGGLRFCFGDGAFKPSTDTFLLGGFAQVRRGERVCDLGAGIGLPGLMLLSREPEVHITDIDIDETACALARRSAEANGLTERIRVVQADLRRREQLPPGGSFDVCVANPPYFPPHTGRVAEGSRGVQRGEGPSSKVSATSPRAAAAGGRRVRFGPSQLQRGSRPAAVVRPWLTISAPSHQAHCAGASSKPMPAAR